MVVGGGLGARYMAVVASPAGTVVVLLAFVCFTALCAVFATQLGNDFQPSEIVPDDSYTKEYFAAASKLELFWDSSIPYNVIFKVCTVYRCKQNKYKSLLTSFSCPCLYNSQSFFFFVAFLLLLLLLLLCPA